MIRRLGIPGDPPMLGYAMREEWAAANPQAVAGFFAAASAAKDLLARDDSEWERLQPVIGTDDAAVLAQLREGFRAGIPRHWGDPERAACAALYAILAEIGGDNLVGPAHQLPAGTFWPGVRF
jgi:NitT/TauT family transport system substrate-binding protein